MKKDLLKVMYLGETLLTVTNQTLTDNFVRCMLSFPTEMTEVTLHYEGNNKRQAKKFVLSQREAVTMDSIGLNWIFPQGTIFYVYH